MKKNKSLYIIVALLALFMMGNVKAAETVKYSCSYVPVGNTDPSEEKEYVIEKYNNKTVVVSFYSATTAKYKFPDSPINAGLEGKIKYWGEKTNDKKYFENKKCYKYFYQEGGVSKGFALTNSEDTLIGANASFILKASKEKTENTENTNPSATKYIEVDNNIITVCPYISSDNKTSLTLNYNKDGIPVKVVSDSTTYSVKVSSALKLILVQELGACQDKVYSCQESSMNEKNRLVYPTNKDSKGKDLINCIKYTYNNNPSDDFIDYNKTITENSGYKTDDMSDYKNNKVISIDPLLKKLSTFKANYDECVNSKGKDKCTDIGQEYVEAYKDSKEYCNKILSTSDYNDSSLKSCLSFKKDMENIGYSDINTNKCGMSDDMRDLLSNIFNIVRFAIPALVIVLGLFDFLRAAASGTEDHMKKAQKQLITRLIAAALIFLAPLVISFFLEQFGFIPDGCGIVNL